MLELVDGADSKSVVSNGVWVRVPPPAPKELNRCTRRKTEEINCKRLFFFLLLQMFIIGLESDIIKKLIKYLNSYNMKKILFECQIYAAYYAEK